MLSVMTTQKRFWKQEDWRQRDQEIDAVVQVRFNEGLTQEAVENGNDR